MKSYSITTVRMAAGRAIASLATFKPPRKTLKIKSIAMADGRGIASIGCYSVPSRKYP